MYNQKILIADDNYGQLRDYLSKLSGYKFLLVHGNSMNRLRIGKFFGDMNVVRFTNFHPNPDYESVVEGLEVYRKENCNAIIAVGGGSAIDVAKCIKAFVNMNPNENYLTQKITPNDIPFIAIPTTAGTGSEATQFAVIYYNGDKISVDAESLIPDAVLFDAELVQHLPEYQKKSVALDAVCHAVESYWSVCATEISRCYAQEAIRLLYANKDAFVKENPNLQCCTHMLYAAHLAGKAINISRTTAGHAMSYKLTGKYKLAHGHAAALCVVQIWKFMIEVADDNLQKIFSDIASAMGFETVNDAVADFQRMLQDWGLVNPVEFNDDDVEYLAGSVNVERLANNPVKMTKDDFKKLYREILKGDYNEH